jgi:hypothetical protein
MLRIPQCTPVNVLAALLPSLATAPFLKTFALIGVDSTMSGLATSTFTLMCMSCNKPDGAMFGGALCSECISDGQNPSRQVKVSDLKSGYLMCHGDEGTCDREVVLSAEACWYVLSSLLPMHAMQCSLPALHIAAHACDAVLLR